MTELQRKSAASPTGRPAFPANRTEPDDPPFFAMQGLVVAIALALISLFLQVMAILALFAAHEARAEGYIGLQVGATQAPRFFDQARFAFPDLAQGGPGCCYQADDTEEAAPAFRFVLGRRFDSGFGIEAAFAHLGRFDSAFEVFGPFGGPRLDIAFGRCTESGRFGLHAASVAGTYDLQGPWGVVLVPRLGLAAALLHYDTTSRCDFAYRDGTASTVQEGHRNSRLSLAPVTGIGLRLPVGKAALRLDAEMHHDVLVNDRPEAQRYGQERIDLASFWLGLEHRW